MPKHYPCEPLPQSSSGPVTSVQRNVVKRLEAARARIEPRMAAVARHFTDFVTLAKAVKSHAHWDYNVQGFGALHTDRARDFAIDIDNRERPQKVTISYHRMGPADLSALPTSSRDYAELMDALPGYGLKFSGSTAGNLSKIAIKPLVPVEFRVVADIPESFYATSRISASSTTRSARRTSTTR